jgi:dipeptidase
MTVKELNELKKKYCIYDDTDDVLDFVSELLHRRAKEIEKNEPYAWRAVEFLDKAAYEVWDLIDYISELEEDENEEMS